MHSYAPFICENKEILTTKSWGLIRQYFSWCTTFKKDRLQYSHDGQRILMCQLAPHSKTCQPAISQRQESIATVMGYVHTRSMPVVSHFYSSLFPPGQSLFNWLAVFISLYYQSDCCFHGRGAYSTAEIGCTSDARMSTLMMYVSDLFRWWLSHQGSTHQGCGIGLVPYQLQPFLWHTTKVASTWRPYSQISCCRIVNLLGTSISIVALVLTQALSVSASVSQW